MYILVWPEHETFLDWVENISDPDQLLYAYDCGIATCPKFYYYSYLSLCPLRLKEDVDSNLAKCRNYTAHATLLMSQLSEIEKLNESSILGCFQLILTFIMICEVKKARKLLDWYGIGGKRAGSPGLVYKSRCVDKDALCMQAIFLLRRAIKLGEEEKNQTMSSLSAAVNMCLPQQSAQAVHNSILAWFLRLPTDLKLFESFESFLKKNENNNFNLNLNDVEEKIRILPLNLLMLLSILTCHKFNYKKNLLNSEKFKISEKNNAQQFNSTDFILIVIRSLIYSLKFKNVDFKKKNFYFSYNTDVVLANIIKEIVKIFLDLTKPGHPWDQDETIKNEVKVYINILLSIVKLRDTFYFQLLLIELLHLLKDLNI
ncbi:hypothetical protein HDU92_005487 [Lobulomyces angularis]|nr:hypothetical protein HDU92_005487 [Lobulomyces angularis]